MDETGSTEVIRAHDWINLIWVIRRDQPNLKCSELIRSCLNLLNTNLLIIAIVLMDGLIGSDAQRRGLLIRSLTRRSCCNVTHISSVNHWRARTRPEETALARFNDLDKLSPKFCKETLRQRAVLFILLKSSFAVI